MDKEKIQSRINYLETLITGYNQRNLTTVYPYDSGIICINDEYYYIKQFIDELNLLKTLVFYCKEDLSNNQNIKIIKGREECLECKGTGDKNAFNTNGNVERCTCHKLLNKK